MNYLLLSGLSTFLACVIEMVEALTIVLAIGVSREWRSTLYAMGVAFLTLIALVGIFGVSLSHIPTRWLWLVVGSLLLIFGLQWLRNAILRLAGLMSTHSEDAAFKRIQHEATEAPHPRSIIDWYAFTVVYKGVFIEGLEVIFIVLAFRASQGSIWIGITAALLALVLVASLGLLLHRPLARLPENPMKFAVGIILTSFGTLFSVQGAGCVWPGGEGAILGILVFYLIVSLALIWLLKRPLSTVTSLQRSR